MEKITLVYYQIPLYLLQKIFCDNRNISNVTNELLNIIPKINFTFLFCYRSNNMGSYGLYKCINSVTNDFYYPNSTHDRNLSHHLEAINATEFPNAMLRFEENILEKYNLII